MATKKQKEIIAKMKDGWIIVTGNSESTGRYYAVITKGFLQPEIRMAVFSRLINDGLIYQQNSSPYDWLLTEKGKLIDSTKQP